MRGPLARHERRPRVRGVVMAGRDGRDVRVPAPLVIAADGRRSRLALPLGLARHPRRPRRWAIGAYFDDVAGLTAFGEMHVRRGRYLGIAPVPPGRNAAPTSCLVVLRAERHAALDGSRDPSRLLLRAIEGDAQAARAIRRRADDGGARSCSARWPWTRGAPARPGCSSPATRPGFIDPMTGDGLRFAVRGGELAAEVGARGARRHAGAPHVRLARLRRREFAAKWRFNRALRALVESRR